MDVQTVYVLASGDYFQAAFNGVATLIGSSSWDSMFRIVLFVAAFVFYFTYIQTHDPLEFIKFIAVFVIVSSLLLIPKATVQIIDRSDPASVYVVDNVPVGLAVPARIITSIGTDMTELYELIFRTPDSATYSKTGMLFGATLVQRANDVFLQNGELANLFGEYVKNCVIGDMMLNHKYSMQDLMNSTDPYTLIFSQPSPLRGVMVPRGSALASAGFHTCQSLARNVLEPQLKLDTSNGGSTWVHYVSRFFGTKPDANVLFANLVGESYDFYYAGGKSASEVMRKNVTMSALRSGIAGTASRNGDTASLVNLASESSYSKMRMSWAASSSISMTFLPVMHTVLLAMLIGMFPLMILLASIHTLTVGILKGFVFTLVYLQAWPPLYAILNYAMTFYLKGKASGMNITLSNVASVQQMHSDVATMSGWLANSIPFLAGAIVFGLWKGVSQAGSYLGTATNSSTSASASNATDGSWAFNNMQMNNASGQKWDTNFAHRDGQMTSQHASGATSTRTGSGQTVYDASSGMSKLPVDVQLAKGLSSSYQAQQRETMSQVQSLSQGVNQSASVGASQLTQWSQQRGNSDTATSGTDNSRGSNFNQAVSKLSNITSRYQRDNNVSQSEAVREAMDKSQNMSVGAGVSAQAKFDTDRQVLGKVASLTTGMSFSAEGHVKGEYTGNSGSSHGTSSDTTNQTGHSKGYSAQELKDIREAVDVISSQRVTDSGSHTQNESGSLANQMSSTFSEMRTQVSQYNDALNRSHEYGQMASYAENNSANIQSNYAQEFVGYVQTKQPQNSDVILTDTSSPTIRAEREQLAQQFVDEKLKPALEQEFANNKVRAAGGMGGVSAPAEGSMGIQAQFAHNQSEINDQAKNNGVQDRGVIATSVQEQRQNTTQQIDSTQGTVAESRQGVQKEYNTLEQEHQGSGKAFNSALEKEKDEQSTFRYYSDSDKNKMSELKDQVKNGVDDLTGGKDK
ncbi:conjugal transfer mating-pair stabilization protein TraG [Yersinia enterocolitica]|uniref:conjugal transfer mating-pair stabilization protein TraG n=1 Tax=Yersinia enterocolitica TaxID=630 RepID=UPI0021AD686F|nr:conjugal transfer mating-pair stabilization protein TraG [Yersinia enterocolitica]